MTPCQEFRLWARRAPTGERVSAGLAAALVLALLVWLLVPGGGRGTARVAATGGGSTAQTATANGSGTGPAAAGEQAAAPGGASAGGPAAAGSSKAGAAGGGSSTNSAAARPGCPSPQGQVTGVTATQIRVAVTLTNVVGPAANSLFGIASPQQQQAWYDAWFAATNASGGVGCRKVVPQYFDANPADQNNLQQTCLDIAQAGVFAEIDNGSYAYFPQKQCFAQHGIPFFGTYFLTRTEREAFYPYLFNLKEFDSLERNTILALRDRGFFDRASGFKKLGFIYQDCDKNLIGTATGAIAEAGLGSADIVTYDVGCPSAFSSPGDLQAAVLKFQQNGVTHVTIAHFVGDFANFTNIAQQQGFRPKYGIPDEDVIDISYGSQRPNSANIAGAVAITSGRMGEERTPGMTPTPGTAKCDAIFQAHGMPPTYKQPPGAGYTCDQLAMFQAAVNNAPALNPSALAAGLQRAKSSAWSYPGGPNDFTGVRATTDGQFWRVTQYMASCSCWQVVDPSFHPSFP